MAITRLFPVVAQRDIRLKSVVSPVTISTASKNMPPENRYLKYP